ncbi:hypothetical protein AV530_006337 [Patagioenas fasciata monilis]|uniref:ALK and LTK ligand 1 n=1 Tax=Patagioenas fasciata monilis TaxID=372326 RepID=A0A1V4KG45_PATFA|nr:hypothetical protein AV530_006337 [Patagioenas fasciata monilis]
MMIMILLLQSVNQQQEILPRDSSLKDKFIKHFTGPVTFSSECSKHFHRLYHNTRDCSTPAYYKSPKMFAIFSTKERILICQESALKSSKTEKTSFTFLIYNILLLDAFYFHIFVRHSIFV